MNPSQQKKQRDIHGENREKIEKLCSISVLGGFFEFMTSFSPQIINLPLDQAKRINITYNILKQVS